MPLSQIVGTRRIQLYASTIGLLTIAPVYAATAELAVSQLIVELDTASRTADVEIVNDSNERAFVAVEPREIVGPGTPGESARLSPDPESLGILVSPRRLILEPRQRRSVRIARLSASAAAERVYRVMVKPAVGDVSGSETGLKLLVGYDLLVISRPSTSSFNVGLSRSAEGVEFTNRGNASVELTDGKYCDARTSCHPLPGKRLYAGATWRQSLPRSATGSYRVRAVTGWKELKF